jgi:hypothetical protein
MAFKNKHGFGYALMAALVMSVLSNNLAFGQTTENEPEIKVSEKLKNNPLIMKVLKNIEISKKKIAEMQKKQLAIDEHTKLIQKQRKIAQENFENALARMNENMADLTPRASFAKFLQGVNETHHDVFWGQFSYQEQKTKLARDAMNSVLKNGGSYADAKQTYYKVASMPRAEIIQLVKELNIQHGFTTAEMQKYFDKSGKLPRTEN